MAWEGEMGQKQGYVMFFAYLANFDLRGVWSIDVGGFAALYLNSTVATRPKKI
jgi:hypothetical protein